MAIGAEEGATRRRLLPFLSCAVLLASNALLQGDEHKAQSAHPSVNSAVAQYTGPGSCSSTSCHGSVRPRTETRIWQNEYSTWVLQDKHARAYTALSGPVALRIARLLKLSQPDKEEKCLACHALSVPPEKRARTFELGDGVSCENCHGPASGWLGAHTTQGWTHQKSLELGMYDTRPLSKRTEKCLTCHLGNLEKSVDHEMIAAGHPDLYFELDSFELFMPEHWKEPLDADPWRDVRAWSTGQAVQLRASLERLAMRTRGPMWPEYAELQCTACHHALTPALESWRQERGYPGRRPGNPPWNAARYAVFREFVRDVNPSVASELDMHLARLAEIMSRLDSPRDAVFTAANESAKLVETLLPQIESAAYDQERTLRLLRRISGDADAISAQGERAADQAAMALNTLVNSYARNAKLPNEQAIRAAITQLFQMLDLPSAYNQFTYANQMRKVNELLR